MTLSEHIFLRYMIWRQTTNWKFDESDLELYCQVDMNVYRRRSCFLKVCIIPFCILVLSYIVWLFWNWQLTFYIQDIDMYVRIERVPFCDVKMYFSKDKVFKADYVKYKNSSDICIYGYLLFATTFYICFRSLIYKTGQISYHKLWKKN